MSGPVVSSVSLAVSPSAPATRSLLRFITCGSVDDGKSSLIGRVLYESGSVPEDQLAALERDSRKFGTQGDQLDYALLVDGLSAEREQGITIDVAYRYFSTPNRAFIVADTPGHEQYTRNMATGASAAELAIILVDARKGILPQTRRHSFIVTMMGVKHVVVAINKMDLVDYAQGVFDAIEAIYRDIAQRLGIPHVTVIPVSAVKGDNIAALSGATPWYRGPTLIDHLEQVKITDKETDRRFAFPVQWVNRPDSNFRGFSGQIASGHIGIGQKITVLPAGHDAILSRIVTFDGERIQAEAGESVTLVLDREVDVSRGDVLALADDPVAIAESVLTQILWMSAEALAPGRTFIAKLATNVFPATVDMPEKALDLETFADRDAPTVGLNTIFRTKLKFDRRVAVARYRDNRDLGAFILIDRITNEVVALGVVLDIERLGRKLPATVRLAKRRIHEPLKRSLLKTASFALATAALVLMVQILEIFVGSRSILAVFWCAFFEILLFFAHERLWARTDRGLVSDVTVRSAGEGI